MYLTVTDMLAAVLNICTQEELMEDTEEATASVIPVDHDFIERRRVIKNKILAVGRMTHLFSLLRFVSRPSPHGSSLTLFGNLRYQ